YATMCIDLEGKILTCNNFSAKQLGFQNKQDLMEMRALDFVANEEYEYALNHYENILMATGNSITDTYPVVMGDGKKMKKTISGSLLLDKRRIPYGILLTLEKTWNKHEERENFELYLSRLRHELKSPLSAITGFVQLLLKDNLPKIDRKDYLKRIQESSYDLLYIIEEINNYPKWNENKIELMQEWFSLDEIFSYIESIGHLLLKQEKKDAELDLLVSGDTDLLFYGDRYRLKQILINLLSNAIKYTNNGFIEYGATKKDNGKIEFFVRDSGIGIPPEQQDIIFKPFRRTEAGRKLGIEGDGLGLSVTKNLIEKMGGDISLYSVNGGGSTFIFSLPAAAEESVYCYKGKKISV
ncbi:MAG: HAMP domain-containing sensor histidine kinase, partial [Spirochaetia bacterium]